MRFEREVRAFSQGCIRTGDALVFAATLLEGAATRSEIDAMREWRPPWIHPQVTLPETERAQSG
ncbi:hypothetical protein [Novosphingobium sp. BW1]|uniref:hypothetical protein n=1 Tax=Novosphingobium sp. BW1 TaxID=2592621 RepID=UPI0011DEE357|nr:hypothetical protein [Novosphingobium sp. BW1]TYC90742.1 hypothetical protein FMM79_05600 [Novosphingobium sp. BW1]